VGITTNGNKKEWQRLESSGIVLPSTTFPYRKLPEKNYSKRMWNVNIRQSTKKEFPQDPMMQELHEIRAKLSKKYKLGKVVFPFSRKAKPQQKLRAA